VREDGRIVGGEEWQEKVHNREEWKKLLKNGKESSHSAHANGIEENLLCLLSPELTRSMSAQFAVYILLFDTVSL